MPKDFIWICRVLGLIFQNIQCNQPILFQLLSNAIYKGKKGVTKTRNAQLFYNKLLIALQNGCE
jgi:hypothetical protein